MQERYETFTALINRISRSVRKLKNQEMAEYDLRSPHISCLYYLYLSDGLTATDLCEKCEADKAAISRTLKYLEDNGYLFYPAQTSKRYRTPLSLTPKGMEAGKKIADKIEHVLESVSIGLTEEERVHFYRYLTILCQNLESLTQTEV